VLSGSVGVGAAKNASKFVPIEVMPSSSPRKYPPAVAAFSMSNGP
jgi:hypothetical protein